MTSVNARFSCSARASSAAAAASAAARFAAAAAGSRRLVGAFFGAAPAAGDLPRTCNLKHVAVCTPLCVTLYAINTSQKHCFMLYSSVAVRDYINTLVRF